MPRMPALSHLGAPRWPGVMKATGFSARCGLLRCCDAMVGTEWNDAMWKADRLIVVSTVLFLEWCQAHEFLEWRLIDFGIGRCSGLWYLFTWNFFGFFEATRYFEMQNDRSCLDVTPQDLGLLESSSLTAAMAPHQQWLSQKMVGVEEDFRKSLGSSRSGWPDAMVAKNPGWLMCRGIWNVWSRGESDTRSLL